MSSDEKKPVVSIGEFFKKGGKATDWEVMKGYVVPSPEAVEFLTEVNDPVLFSLADRQAQLDDVYGMDARKNFMVRLRVNMIPYKRKHNESVKDAWVAVSLQSLFKQENVKDKLFGDQRR